MNVVQANHASPTKMYSAVSTINKLQTETRK